MLCLWGICVINTIVGKEPDEIYCDKGISGKRADRPELIAALEA
jgi:hypothetical protein